MIYPTIEDEERREKEARRSVLIIGSYNRGPVKYKNNGDVKCRQVRVRRPREGKRSERERKFRSYTKTKFPKEEGSAVPATSQTQVSFDDLFDSYDSDP